MTKELQEKLEAARAARAATYDAAYDADAADADLAAYDANYDAWAAALAAVKK